MDRESIGRDFVRDFILTKEKEMHLFSRSVVLFNQRSLCNRGPRGEVRLDPLLLGPLHGEYFYLGPESTRQYLYSLAWNHILCKIKPLRVLIPCIQKP